MKKLLLTLAWAVGAINSGFAADLYVNNSGQSGTYTTINLALAAASSGDRIFVSPLNYYPEDLVITKSITIAPTNSDSKIALSGNIAIQPVPNMDITLIGIEMNGLSLSSVASTATISNPASLSLISCTVINNSNMLVNALKIKVHDCKFKGYLWTKFIEATKSYIYDLVVDEEANQSATDSVRVIACWMRSFEWSSKDYYLFLSNSYIHEYLVLRQIPSTLLPGKSSITNCYIGLDLRYLLYPAGTLDWSGLSIENSRIRHAYAIYLASLSSSNYGNRSYLMNSSYCWQNSFNNSNNLYYWANAGTVNASKAPNLTYCGVNAPLSNALYSNDCYWRDGYYSFAPKENLTGVVQQDLLSAFHYNVGNSGVTITESDPFEPTWIQQFNGFLENQGSPASNHVDLDLSRNDIGILGGSHSWLNYWYNETSTTGNAVIRWIDLPSEIWPGQSVNLKAEAVHTN